MKARLVLRTQCPNGCGGYLVGYDDGAIRCTHPRCPDPYAAEKILSKAGVLS